MRLKITALACAPAGVLAFGPSQRALCCAPRGYCSAPICRPPDSEPDTATAPAGHLLCSFRCFHSELGGVAGQKSSRPYSRINVKPDCRVDSPVSSFSAWNSHSKLFSYLAKKFRSLATYGARGFSPASAQKISLRDACDNKKRTKYGVVSMPRKDESRELIPGNVYQRTLCLHRSVCTASLLEITSPRGNAANLRRSSFQGSALFDCGRGKRHHFLNFPLTK